MQLTQKDGFKMRKKVKGLLRIFFIGFCIIGLQIHAAANKDLLHQEIISISEAKIDIDSNFIPDRLGDTVSISGRVSVNSGILSGDHFQIAIQDHTAGIFIFSFENKLPKVSFGDSIHLTGIVDQYRGLTQLINPEISFIDTVNRKTIKPIQLKGNNIENSESKIVTITSHIIQKKHNSGGSYLMLAPPEGFDQPLMIFNPNFHKSPNLLEKYKVGEKIKITGLLTQHDYNKRPDGHYQILPFSSKNLILKQFSVLFYLYLIGGGILITLFIIFINIFLRKKVKNRTKQLKESESRFSDLTESTSSAILIHLDNQFVYANQAIEKISGFSKGDILFLPLNQLMKIDENKLVRVKQSKKTYRAESQFSLSNGNQIWLDYTIAPITWDNKNASIITAVDVTEKKKLFNELIVSKNKAEENDRLKTAFLNNISHELRTPMNGILGFSELLKNPDIRNDKRDQFLCVIEKSGQRMLNTITQIVEISKIETKQIELDIKKTNLNKIITDLYNSHKPETDSKNLKLICQSGLPDDQAMIKTDSNKLSQILEHLLTNAIKFTKSGSISFGYKIIDKRIEFFVSDTGIGLTPEYKENVFKSFTQGSTAYTRDYEGLGLGLSIAMAYVELLGGKINIESELGKGATFLFYIPYIKEKASVKNNIKEISKNNNSTNQILIVEDEPTSMQFLRIILKGENLNLLYATNGEEAIELIKNRSDINIVLMDLKMPGIDGFETTKKIKALKPDLRVIAQTAFAFETDKEKAFSAGCDEYITKPIKKDLLMEKINLFLN